MLVFLKASREVPDGETHVGKTLMGLWIVGTRLDACARCRDGFLEAPLLPKGTTPHDQRLGGERSRTGEFVDGAEGFVRTVQIKKNLPAHCRNVRIRCIAGQRLIGRRQCRVETHE
jgi:hypothetical protein